MAGWGFAMDCTDCILLCGCLRATPCGANAAIVNVLCMGTCCCLASWMRLHAVPMLRHGHCERVLLGNLLTLDAAGEIKQRLLRTGQLHSKFADCVLQDGLTSDEMLLLGLEEDSEKLPFFSGCHVYPLFPGESARYSLFVFAQIVCNVRNDE